MPRWNGRLDGSGTPPRLRPYARQPDKFDQEIRAIAKDHGCTVSSGDGVLWERLSWYVYVTLEGTEEDVLSAFEEMEAEDVHELVTSDEKKRHPNAMPDSGG
jgi:hypothetical protein